jgi:hypothetical protein
MRKDFVEMAERADADMLAKEPGGGRADRIARGFAQQFLVRRGLGGKWMDEQRPQWRKDYQPPHARLPSGRTFRRRQVELLQQGLCRCRAG